MGPVTRAKLGVGQTRSFVVAADKHYLPNGTSGRPMIQGEDLIEGDGASMESDNSQRIIIKKTVELDVVRHASR